MLNILLPLNFSHFVSNECILLFHCRSLTDQLDELSNARLSDVGPKFFKSIHKERNYITDK